MTHAMNNTSPVIELAKRLRRAARNGARLHLEQCQVAILMGDNIYGVICALEAKEIRRTCATAVINDNDISSGTSGCGSGIAAPGASAGSNVIPMDAASRGASLLLREEAGLMRRRKRH